MEKVLQIVNLTDCFQVKKNDDIIFDGEIKSKLLHANIYICDNKAYTSVVHRNNGPDKNCGSCKFGKLWKNKFSKVRERTEIIGEEFSMDLAGPFDPTSPGGSKYFINVVDKASNYVWFKAINHKSDTPEEIRIPVNRWERQGLLKKLKRVITDGGGEFTGKEFQNLINNWRLVHVTTTPHTPQ